MEGITAPISEIPRMLADKLLVWGCVRVKILVLNCGGSSMKYQLIDMDEEKVLAKGMIDRLGTDRAVLRHKSIGETELKCPTEIMDFADGIKFVMRKLVEGGFMQRMEDISAFAHKLAHGGETFREPLLLTDEVISVVAQHSILAPVHNPPSLAGIEMCQRLFPSIPQVAIFETAFHRTVPDYAYIYGVPFDWYAKHKVRKYGFHGVSHSYVTDKASDLVGRPKEELKIVSCHLGSGTSVAAIKFGRSVDISSGFTPQSGTVMSTRPGDFDPWVFPYLMEREQVSAEDLNSRLVKEGGLLGISGVSGDMRDILDAARTGNDRARLAVEVFCYHVKKYIGSYAAIMNGLDVLAFTGGIGEHSSEIRAKVGQDMDFLGIMIDSAKNASTDPDSVISAGDSRVMVVVIAANEEIVVARQAVSVLSSASNTR
jgi:acetate kinase